jgi:lipopolysaccharide/colanic/teichoic acid biosynthesis glycosyltransferase
MYERTAVAGRSNERSAERPENIRHTHSGRKDHIASRSRCDGIYAKYIKRFLDLIASIILLPALILVMAVVAPVILMTDGSPVFYNAPRLGYRGREFIMFKFRSMKLNAPDIRLEDGSTFNSDDDPRQTKIGKFLRKTSIDELPQILNVLIGNMSFVGPRPDLPEHRQNYEGNEAEKLNVRPGITGFSQAYYRNTIVWKERLKNDVYYANNISFLLDLKIMAHTVIAVARRENVYVEQQAAKDVKKVDL